MNQIARIPQRDSALVTAEHAEAVRTALKSSLYPGASDASVDLVLAYCEAARLDPMQKPVHIVPMWDGKAREMRDVVMPGIGLYRTNAARTGQFAGMSEPEFGPMITERVGNREITYPEWCKVTAYRQLPSGHVAEFTAVEYWIENYAIKGGKEQDQSPNAMWSKRVRGQLAKCAQAQALRMAFPEAVGAAPTAEEMEGKAIDGEFTAVTPDRPSMPQAKAKAEPETPQSEPDAQAGINDLSPGQRKILAAKAKSAGFILEDGELDEPALLERFPSIGPANINDVLAQLREIAEQRDAQ